MILEKTKHSFPKKMRFATFLQLSIFINLRVNGKELENVPVWGSEDALAHPRGPLCLQYCIPPPPQMWLTTLNPRPGLESKFPKGQKLQISRFHPVWSFPLPRFSTQEDTFIHTSVAWRYPLTCLGTRLTLCVLACARDRALESCVCVYDCVWAILNRMLFQVSISKNTKIIKTSNNQSVH